MGVVHDVGTIVLQGPRQLFGRPGFQSHVGDIGSGRDREQRAHFHGGIGVVADGAIKADRITVGFGGGPAEAIGLGLALVEPLFGVDIDLECVARALLSRPQFPDANRATQRRQSGPAVRARVAIPFDINLVEFHQARGSAVGGAARKWLGLNHVAAIRRQKCRRIVAVAVRDDVITRNRHLDQQISGRGTAVFSRPCGITVVNGCAWCLRLENDQLFIDLRHRRPRVAARNRGQVRRLVHGVAADRHVPDAVACERPLHWIPCMRHGLGRGACVPVTEHQHHREAGTGQDTGRRTGKWPAPISRVVNDV